MIQYTVEYLLENVKSILRVLAVVALLSIGAWGGCTVGKSRSAEAIQNLNKQVATLTGQVQADAAVINIANAQVMANKQFSKEREELAEQAAKEAAQAKKELAEKHKEYQQKIKDAEKDTSCQAILEMELCPLLRDY